jgi:hypothetical protein
MTTPEPSGPGWRRPAVVTAVAVLVLALVAGAVLLLGGDNGRGVDRNGDRAPAAAGGTSAPVPSLPGAVTSSPTSTASGTPTPARTEAKAGARLTCSPPSGGFDPRRISVPGVVRAATVVMPPRDPGGVPGTPPLTTTGKTEFAYDRAQHVQPGSPAGNVLLNAHTWPDGTALGNHLLSGLHVGDRIVVVGAGTTLCYRVTQRVEVLASNGLASYYDRTGPPQLAIVVCSGRRLGPGVWTKRTVWFASPRA